MATINEVPVRPTPTQEAVYGHKVGPQQDYERAYVAPYRAKHTTPAFQAGVYGVPFAQLPTFSNLPTDNHLTSWPGRSGLGTRGLPINNKAYYLDYTPRRVGHSNDPQGSFTRQPMAQYALSEK